MNEPDDIIAALHDCQTVLISVHKNPDGDALGSQLGLMIALEKAGKKVVAHNLDPVPEIYHFLPWSGRISTGPRVNGTFDVFLVLDADPARTGLFNGSWPARTLINIDHHVTNRAEWPITWLKAVISQPAAVTAAGRVRSISRARRRSKTSVHATSPRQYCRKPSARRTVRGADFGTGRRTGTAAGPRATPGVDSGSAERRDAGRSAQRTLTLRPGAVLSGGAGPASAT